MSVNTSSAAHDKQHELLELKLSMVAGDTWLEYSIFEIVRYLIFLDLVSFVYWEYFMNGITSHLQQCNSEQESLMIVTRCSWIEFFVVKDKQPKLKSYPTEEVLDIANKSVQNSLVFMRAEDLQESSC